MEFMILQLYAKVGGEKESDVSHEKLAHLRSGKVNHPCLIIVYLGHM